jgi:hypothetical protein
MKRLVLISCVALCVMLWAIIASADDGGKLSSPSAIQHYTPNCVNSCPERAESHDAGFIGTQPDGGNIEGRQRLGVLRPRGCAE